MISKNDDDYDWSRCVGKGWHEIVSELTKKIKEIDPGFKIDQVKEKFGTLRYYITLSKNCSENDIKIIYDEIGKAEKESGKICEMCGKPGKLSKVNWWILTLCDDCHDKRSKGNIK